MNWIINILSNYLRFIANIVAVFLLTPFIIAHLGTDQFGLWSLIFAVVSLFGLLDLGLATTAVKHVSECYAARRLEQLSQTLGTLILIYSLLGLICFAGAWSVAPHIAQGYGLSVEQEAGFVLALRVLGFVTALSFPLSVYRAILIGTGRMAWVNLTDLIFIMTNAGLIYLALSNGLGLEGLALSTAATIFLSFVVFVPSARLASPEVKIDFRSFDPQTAKNLFSFSVYIFVANIAMLIILRIDPMVIGQFLTLEAVAIYAIAAKVAEYTYLLNKQFSNALMPLISQSNGVNDAQKVRVIMLDGTRFLLAIAIPFVSLLFWFAPELIQLWVGESFSQAATLLRILLVGVMVSCLQLLPANVLGMGGQHQKMAKVMAGSAVLNLLLSILLVQLYGLTGVAVATLGATLAAELLLILPLACRNVGVTPIQYLSRVLRPAFLPSAVMLVTTYWLSQSFPIDSLLQLILIGALSGLSFLLSFMVLGTTAQERALLTSKLNRFDPRKSRSLG